MNDQQIRHTPITDYLRIFYRGRWIISTCFVIVMSLTVYYTYTTIPMYQASAKVMVVQEKGMGFSLLDAGGFVKQATRINNQVEILKGRALSKTVAQHLLESEYADQLAILGTSSKSVWSQAENSEDVFEAKLRTLTSRLRNNVIVVPIHNTDMISITTISTSAEEAALIANTFTQAYTEMNRAMSRAEVRQVKTFLEDQLNTIKNELGNSENALKEFLEVEKNIALSSETGDLIDRLSEFESLYNEAQTELQSYHERMLYIDKQLGYNSDIESLAATAYAKELRSEMAEVQKRRATHLAYLVNSGTYDRHNSKLKEYDKQLEIIKKKYKSENAKLAELELAEPLASNEELLTRKLDLETEIAALNPKVASLKRIVDEYTRDLENLPKKKLDLAKLQRATQVHEKLYLMMKEKYEELRITEVGQLGDIRVIEPAEPPSNPIGSNRKTTLVLGALFGLGLGIGISSLINMVDSSVRSSDDIEKMGQPFLGAIPVIKNDDELNRLELSTNGATNGEAKFGANGKMDLDEYRQHAARLITHFVPKSPISEAYRALRTNIQYTRVDQALRTMLVTSPGPAEGKSTSAANLAITMAQTGNRVVLVDADLRRPVLHSIFKLDRSVGLTNVLVGKVDIDEALKKTDIENLHVLTCGTLPPNPSELLDSAAMKRTLKTLMERFEIVLFDSPPVIAVTDAAVLARNLDGVILVVKAGKTHREAAFRAFNLLKNLNANILGTVLNYVKLENVYGSYYYYNYHYYYGKQNGKSNEKSKRQEKKIQLWPWT